MFSSITAVPTPPGALLDAYDLPGHYVDCFRVRSSHPVEHTRWLQAFLGSRVFRMERQLLARGFGVASDDNAVAALIAGQAETFAVWSVEHRAPQELLLQDRSLRTRTWWRTEATRQHGASLYFGSALVPARDQKGEPSASLGPWRWSIPAHRAYSRLLVHSARAALQRLR